ncbi:MAG: ABC transporter permease, partial [Cytophagaceae bacterium]
MLTISTLIVSRQIHYIQSKDLGYDRENLIYLPLKGEMVNGYDVFKTEALKMPGIKSVTRTSENPTVIENSTGGISWQGKNPDQDIEFTQASAGYDFIRTMSLKLLQGRDFSRAFATDTSGYLLNEAAQKLIGYKNPVGQPLDWGGYKGHIIGVLNDFHFNSMRQAIEPLIIRLDRRPQWGTILVRAEAGKTQEAIASLEKVCKELNPLIPFIYQFSDQEYAKLYRSEQVVSQLATYFAILAIFISCLGLFGLAAFTAEQRTKEIGVRKVLGASITSIVALLSRDFLK